jgi:hypothetical protein
VGRLRERGIALHVARRRLLLAVEVEERRGGRQRVGGGVAAGPAPELPRVHLHDPRAEARERGVSAVGQTPAVHRRKRDRLRARLLRDNPLLRTDKKDENFNIIWRNLIDGSKLLYHAAQFSKKSHLLDGYPARRRLELLRGCLEAHERLKPAQSRVRLLPHEVATHQSLQLHERLQSAQGLPSLHNRKIQIPTVTSELCRRLLREHKSGH